MRKYFWLVICLLLITIGLFVHIVYIAGNSPAVTTGFPNTIQRVLPSVVHIMCNQWQGSGVAITEDIVVTARHVIDGEHYSITLNSGETVYGIQAITHKDYDIGFIKIENAYWLNGNPKLKPAKFGSVEGCVLGQPIFIIGSPFGKMNFNNITLGIISGLERDWDGISWSGKSYGWKIAFTSDAGTHPGNSGGPVFSMDGVVRGLLVGGFSPVLNCSMPSDLFLNDVGIIKLLFAFQKYKVEKEQEYNYAPYYEGFKNTCPDD